MNQFVKWGILGGANFALEHMAPAIHQSKNAKLVALATSSKDKFSAFQAFCPDLEHFTDYDALLNSPDIDAVYIPLPNHLHVEWTKRALKAGKHVLCEKPIAMHASQIDELISLRDETGVLAAEAYMIVHHPQWIRARELFNSGAIGKLIRVDGAFSYNNAEATDNIRNRPETGGGGIPDIGVYTYGSTRFVTGEEPDRVNYVDIKRENEIDTYAQVNVSFPSFELSVMTSMRMAPRQEMVFHGDTGVMKLKTPFNAGVFGEATIELSGADPTVTHIERFPTVQQYRNQVENFGNSVLNGAEYPCSLECSRGTQAMIDMILAAE